jgi:hypothetical protein
MRTPSRAGQQQTARAVSGAHTAAGLWICIQIILRLMCLACWEVVPYEACEGLGCFRHAAGRIDRAAVLCSLQR